MTTKICSRCKIEKDISKFCKDSHTKDGFSFWCRDCKSQHSKIYRNKPEVKQRIYLNNKQYTQTSPEKRKRREYNRRPCVKQRVNEYKKTEKGKAAVARYHSNRKTKERNLKNDLKLDEWLNIINMQNNICPICNKSFTEENPPTRDHIIPASSPWCIGLTKGNVQAVHNNCNCSKGNRFDIGNAIDNLLLH